MHGAHNHQSQSDAAQVVLVGISGRLTEVALQENLILQDNAMHGVRNRRVLPSEKFYK
jgi:hypothetical protein